MSRLFPLTALALLLAIASPAGAQPLKPSDQQLLNAVSDLERTAGHAPRAWLDFSVTREPLVLVDKGRVAILVGHPHPPKGFVRLPGGPNGTYARWGATTDLDSAHEFNAMLGETRVTVLPYAYLLYDTRLTPGRFVAPMFATFAKDNFADYPEFRHLSDTHLAYPTTDAENTALCAVEAKCLGAALSSPNSSQAEQFGRLAAAVHRVRQARLAPAVKRYENLVETFEGAIRYVDGVLGASGTPHPGGLQWSERDANRRAIAGLLSAPLDNEATRRTHFSACGTALGLIMDRAGYVNWKGMVTSGLSISETFGRSLKLQDGEIAGLVTSAKTLFSYDQLLALEKDTWARYPADYKSFMATVGTQWVISGLPAVKDFGDAPRDQRAAANEWLQIDSPSAPLEIDARTLLAYRMNTLLYRKYDISLLLNQTPFLMQSKSLAWPYETLTLFTPVGEGRIELDGKTLPMVDGTYPFKKHLEIQGGHLIMMAPQGTLTIAGKTVTIQLGR